ncbi:hypothetical protein HOR63_gp07 [Escherichia phage vB_EcoS_CEB_EC3a]|uniref:Uncharacterized protein n=1 Tax=Escherichia phage vB_EcoS_CEB_EC3a TaxID=1933774 RepID=A0A1Q1PWD3_9CAUD|nr:hypothetical protein HOR63_gp07 [Escherichia phage vB_EcoS_CEB_EC3a]AQN32401.1 hypothetical protein Ec3a_06 [Escherichia phage vB_EcoS_CEB_EC3a]
MITINLSEKDASTLKQLLSGNPVHTNVYNFGEVEREVIAQINNQQFDVSDFESSRQYEAMSVNAAYLTNWDKATNK